MLERDGNCYADNSFRYHSITLHVRQIEDRPGFWPRLGHPRVRGFSSLDTVSATKNLKELESRFRPPAAYESRPTLTETGWLLFLYR